MTIKYSEINVGDILKLVGAGAPGYGELGDLVRVKKVFAEAVLTENKRGQECEFVFNCGASDRCGRGKSTNAG